MTADSERRPIGLAGVVLRTGLLLFIGCLALILLAAAWYWPAYSRQQAALAAIVTRIRVAGEPLGRAELDAYYPPPAGEDDLTGEYLRALAMFPSVGLTEETKKLPIVAGSFPIPSVGEPWDMLPVAADYLAPLQPQLDLLRELGKRRGRVRYPTIPANGAVSLGTIQAIREAARRLSLDFYVRLHHNDRAGALESLIALIRLGETLGEEPSLIAQLVRCPIFGMSLPPLQMFLADGRATEEELTAIEAVLQPINFADGLRRALRGSRAESYAMLYSSWTVRELSGEDSSTSSAPELSLKTLTRLRPGDAAALLETETDLIAAADRSLPEALRGLKEISANADRDAFADRQSPPWSKNHLATVLRPQMGSHSDAFGRVAALRDAALVAIAIERRRLRSGELPDQLDDLVPEFLVPAPIDSFNGALLSFARDQAGYTVYSVGPDGVDQGGKVTSENGWPPDVGLRIECRSP